MKSGSVERIDHKKSGLLSVCSLHNKSYSYDVMCIHLLPSLGKRAFCKQFAVFHHYESYV